MAFSELRLICVNRLADRIYVPIGGGMYAQVYDTAPMPDELRSATYYEYSADGNVTRVITEEFAVGGGQSGPMAPSGNRQFSAVRFGYAHNEQALLFAHGETWEWDGVSASVTNYQKPWAREFRYDGARARYMNRTLNPDTLATIATTWSDYDQDDIYGDFTVAVGPPLTVTSTDKYEAGLWRRSAAGVVDYVHNDHLGTLRRRSDAGGLLTTGSANTFTAFGEAIVSAGDRFGYVGGFGYQSHAEMPFLHVGHRYYDPASGRFLQRDPVGLAGGRNVYAYAINVPTRAVDPIGLAPAILESDVTQGIGVVLCVAAYWVPVLVIPGGLLWGGATVWDGVGEAVDAVEDAHDALFPPNPPPPSNSWPRPPNVPVAPGWPG